ncbi:MAG TPA: hypothetical protein VGM38_09400 [Pseudolysinimonas sp.]|jgi:hypothetical protein
MGTVTHFDIGQLTELYDLHYFVETGVGQAVSLAEVVENHFFRAYYSCDWDEIMVRASRHRMADNPCVHIEHARSADFLSSLLEHLPRSSPILFWLDAHFPMTNKADDGLVLPLASELDIIARLRPEGRDVIAIDDLAIYTDGPFQTPLIEGLRPWCPEERGIRFVHEAIGKTHHIELSYDDGGYILATPSESYLS